MVPLFASSIAAKHGNNFNLLIHLRIYLSKLHGKVTVIMANGKRSKEVIETAHKSEDLLTLGTVLECT